MNSKEIIGLLIFGTLVNAVIVVAAVIL